MKNSCSNVLIAQRISIEVLHLFSKQFFFSKGCLGYNY